MSSIGIEFNRFPRSVRLGFILLLGGWILHLGFVYLAFGVLLDDLPAKIIYQQVAIGGLLFFFLYRVKKWARVLCLLCNGLIIILYIGIAALFARQHQYLMLLAALVIGCFAAATFFFMAREARAFYAGPQDTASSSPRSRQGGT